MVTHYCTKSDWIISVILVSILVFILPNHHLKNAFIISGQAHFILTYLYQFRNGKYHSKPSSWLYPLIAFIIISPLALYNKSAFIVLLSSMFLLHNFNDEMRLLGIRNNSIRLACTLPALLNLVAYGSFGKFINEYHYLKYLFVAIALGVPASLFFRNDLTREELYYDIYNAIFVTFVAISLFFKPTFIPYIWTHVVINHYMMWYLKMGRVFHAQGTGVFSKNLLEIIAVNVAILVLWIASDKLSSPVIYEHFFSPLAFYVWTLPHLLVTLRASDYSSFLNFLDINSSKNLLRISSSKS